MPNYRVRYQTIEFGDTDIHIKSLRNRQEYDDPNRAAHDLGITSANWSLFGVVWASGELLARIMHTHEIAGKRILEVGCGLALASLVLNSRSANITATDYHPESEAFLLENTQLNGGELIPFHRTSWRDEEDALGKFDIIIGGDLLYEREQAGELAHFIDQHAQAECEVIIIDPGRKHQGRFSKLMAGLGFDFVKNEITPVEPLTQPNRGCSRFNRLNYSRSA